MTIEEITDLSNYLNGQADLPVKIQKIADMLKSELEAPVVTPPSETTNG